MRRWRRRETNKLFVCLDTETEGRRRCRMCWYRQWKRWGRNHFLNRAADQGLSENTRWQSSCNMSKSAMLLVSKGLGKLAHLRENRCKNFNILGLRRYMMFSIQVHTRLADHRHQVQLCVRLTEAIMRTGAEH